MYSPSGVGGSVTQQQILQSVENKFFTKTIKTVFFGYFNAFALGVWGLVITSTILPATQRCV
jgi:hypothetical protein